MSEQSAPPGPRHLTILHYNDVYNIENCDRAGYVSGAARLAGLVKSIEAEVPALVLFSGDAFSPSSMSTVTLGSHMPPVLNSIGTHAACIGNHDFDLGLETALSLIKQCNFPWLSSNVKDKNTGDSLPSLLETLIIEHHGVRVGLMGLVEGEWLDTLAHVDPELLEYKDFVEEGKRLGDKLRADGADLVVAITHMRVPNDRLLAASVPGIDLVLGGHDHHYEVDFVEPHHTLMVKSGTDFRDLTRIDITLPPTSSEGIKPTMIWTRIPITIDSPEHPPTKEVVQQYSAIMGVRMNEVIGYSLSDLDSRFTTIRLAESNMGNLVTDVLRQTMRADIVIINSGTLRSDQVHPAGVLTVRDIISLLPMPDMMVTLEATGAQILEALENGVSQVPRLEGRFPQVSGIRFKYDSSRPAGSRIVPGSAQFLPRLASHAHNTWTLDRLVCDKEKHDEWQPLDVGRTYRVAVKAYMADGKDGYDVLAECKQLVDIEEGQEVAQALRNHFRSLHVLNMWDPKVKTRALFNKWRQVAAARKAADHATDGHQHHSPLDVVHDDHHDPAVQAALDTPQPSEDGGPEDLSASVLKLQSCMPMRTRLVTASTGICVLTPEHGYGVNSVIEGRIVDVSGGQTQQQPQHQ